MTEDRPRALEQVLADARSDAQRFRARGQAQTAELIEQLCAEFSDATEDYRTFINEVDARIRSGWALSRLRRAFREWEPMGHARMEKSRRYYREVMLPQRANTNAAREAGRQAAERHTRHEKAS